MTDIMKGKLIELDIDSHANRVWEFDQPLAWILPTTFKGKYLLGFRSGIALYDLSKPSDIYWVSKDFPGAESCRLNDACVDSTGKVWYGSMNMLDPSSKDGQLASFSVNDGPHIHDSGFTVTNGPVISPDGRYLYLNDTLEGVVYRYSIDTNSGRLIDRQIFIKFDGDRGFPDGMCFDAEGNLWIALWGGASVAQVDSNGKLLRMVAIPALNVTNLCFCGFGLDRLIVSTASIGLSEEEARRYPASGALFEIYNHRSVGVASYAVPLEPLWT